MDRRILLLRVTFWWGVIADAVETIRMLLPDVFKSSMSLNLPVDGGLRFGLLYGMPVMLGWTLLLFWAGRKPLERRDILLCLIPVIVAYVGVEVFAASRGWVSLQTLVPTFVLQAILLSLSAVSYRLTEKLAVEK